MKKMYIIKSSFKDIYKNLALESCLFRLSEKENCPILFLWENNSAVVIGKHQNPHTECDLEYLRKNKIKLSRRITGGGAVYHTKGNVNFSFIVPAKHKEKTQNIIQNSLLECGIKTKKTGRNDLTINNKKFSGNAYFKTKNTYLHHGTILINMNFEKIQNILTPNLKKLTKNSVKSVNSRVINLNKINPKINKQQIFKAVEKEFINTFGIKTNILRKIEIDKNDFYEEYKKFKSKKWIYKNFKNYKTVENFYLDAGSLEVLKNNKNEYLISTDIVSPEIIENLEEILKKSKNIKRDIINFLKIIE